MTDNRALIADAMRIAWLSYNTNNMNSPKSPHQWPTHWRHLRDPPA